MLREGTGPREGPFRRGPTNMIDDVEYNLTITVMVLCISSTQSYDEHKKLSHNLSLLE